MSEKLPRKGKLEIYRSSGTSLVQTFSDKALGDMIESSANITYPANVNAFIPYKLGYENNHILIVYIQPQRTGDATPGDAGLKINLQTNKASGTTEFFERTNRPPLPEHPSKKIYQFEVKNVEMFVNGQKLQKLASGLDEDLHDEVTITK